MSNLQQSLANRIVALRHQLDLTQVQLAKKTGISQVGISLIESGNSWPRPETLAKLAAALGVTPAELFRK